MAYGTGAAVALIEEPLVLSDRDLARVVKLVYQRAGINLHDGKRELITARLQKRLRVLRLSSFGPYLDLLDRDATGDEMTAFLDALATNHTSFFREQQHFDLLQSRIVPELLARPGRPSIDTWSAACSTGEEPYTLAMTLAESLPTGAEGFRMLASDLSTKALSAARSATYKLERVKDLPINGSVPGSTTRAVAEQDAILMPIPQNDHPGGLARPLSCQVRVASLFDLPIPPSAPPVRNRGCWQSHHAREACGMGAGQGSTSPFMNRQLRERLQSGIRRLLSQFRHVRRWTTRLDRCSCRRATTCLPKI
jgi:hypothetical protein